MHKLMHLVRLDFMMCKTYLRPRYLFFYLCAVVLLTALTENMAIGVGAGAILGMLSCSYPFAVGEKSKLDSLYPTLAIERKGVVRGRYLFALISVCGALVLSLLLSCLVALIGTPLGLALEIEIGGTTLSGLLIGGIAFLVVVLLVLAMQIPLYFKLGYTKARFLAMLPLFALYILFFGAATFIKAAFGSTEALFALLSENVALFCVLTLALVALALFVSYRLSQALYEKREF